MSAQVEEKAPQPESQSPKKQKKKEAKNVKNILGSILSKYWSRQKKLKILVTGKTGQGKSTLINGLLGKEVAKEGAGCKRITTHITKYTETIEKVPIRIYDSPGLQDRLGNEEEYIEEMRNNCKKLSLVLYCRKMTNVRLTDDDREAMRKLTKAFGHGFWEYTVFILTFANLEDVERRDDRDKDKGKEPADDDDEAWNKLKKERFEGRIKIWKDGLREFLEEEIKVDPQIAANIPVIPVGDYKKTRKIKEPFRLPDRDNWFLNFWEVCCGRVKETYLFLKANSHRMKIEQSDNEDEDDDSQDEEIASENPLIPDEEFKASMKNVMEELLATPKLKKGKETASPKPTRQRRPSKDLTSVLSVSDVTPSPPAKPLPQTEDSELIQQYIPVNRKLIQNVTAEAVRKAGFDESTVEATKVSIQQMKQPTHWFMRLLHNIPRFL